MADVTSIKITAPLRARLVVELMDDGSVRVIKEGEVCLLWRYLATVVAAAQAA